MALITGIGVFVVAVLTTTLARLLAEEMSAWSPSLVRCLVKLAVQRLPESKRERFEEEWQGHVNEIPGLIGKLYVAVGFVIAACDMGLSEQRTQTRMDVLRRIDNAYSASMAALNILHHNGILASHKDLSGLVSRMELTLSRTLEERHKFALLAAVFGSVTPPTIWAAPRLFVYRIIIWRLGNQLLHLTQEMRETSTEMVEWAEGR